MECDWKGLYEKCRTDALRRGASEADAEDIAQESIARTIAASAAKPAYARRTAKSIAGKLSRGEPSRGITSSAHQVGYVEDPGPLQVHQWQASVMPTCQLHRNGLAREAEQESYAIAVELAEELEPIIGDELARARSRGSSPAADSARYRVRSKARKAMRRAA